MASTSKGKTIVPEALLQKIRSGARADEALFVEGLQELAELIRAERRWIPVTERMPEMGEPVEILGDHRGSGGVAWFADPFKDGNPYWNLCTIERGERVSHWRPLGDYPYIGDSLNEDFDMYLPATWPENR